MPNTRIFTCALAAAGLPFIGSQAAAQGGPNVNEFGITEAALNGFWQALPEGCESSAFWHSDGPVY
jgi:hypothetical protein